MTTVLPFRKQSDDFALEAEFRTQYQEIGALYLGYGAALAILGFGSFYLLDIFYKRSAIGNLQTLRLEAIGIACVVVGLTIFRRDIATKYYVAIANAFCIVMIQLAAWVVFEARSYTPAIDIYWGMITNMMLAALLIYAFSRLTTLNTAVIVISGCFVGGWYALQIPAVEPTHVARLILHLLIVNVVACFYRWNAEARERRLFLLAKENLQRNIYAQELETSKLLADEGNAAKMRFLANMSHEVRTPMHGLLQIFDVLSLTAQQRDKLLIEKGRRSGKALLRILDGILSYTKLTHQSSAVAKSNVSVTETCQTVLSLHAAAVSVKGIDVKLRLDLVPLIDIVVVDEVKLFEILNNLVSNAIKFTEVGSVSIAAKVVPNKPLPYPDAILEIEVADTGIGLEPSESKRIFEPFYQVDDGPSRKVGGTGLGLAIVRELLAVMQGEIRVESSPGVGTSMWIAIPVQIAEGSVPSSGSKSPRPPLPGDRPKHGFTSAASDEAPFEGRVLLVEDNELNSMMSAQLLELYGCQVVAAANGLEAVEEFSKGPFELVLMDCQMPLMDGFAATERIRECEKQTKRPHTPIVALTANTLPGDRERCLSAGMDDFLGKPYDPEQLRTLLAKWIGQLQHESPLPQ